MNHVIISLFSLAVLAVAVGVSGGKDEPEPRAGWLGVFPELAGYQRTFGKPMLDPKEKPTAYWQTAEYEWTGGAIRRLTVMPVHRRGEKKRYSAEEVGKEKIIPARAAKVGKFSGWLWQYHKEGEAKPGQKFAQLVLLLSDDKVVVFEAWGPGPWAESLPELAGRFDLTRMAAALDAPPRADFRRSLEEFRPLPKGTRFQDLLAWLGSPDKSIPGGATHTWVYMLPDGSQVQLRLDYDPKDLSKPSQLREAIHHPKDGKPAVLTP